MSEDTINSGTGNTRDTRLLERAIKKRWPIPEQYKEAIMRRQALIAIDPKAKPREASAAARTLIAADKLNLEEEQMEMDSDKQNIEQHLHLHGEVIPHSKIFYDLPPVKQLPSADNGVS